MRPEDRRWRGSSASRIVFAGYVLDFAAKPQQNPRMDIKHWVGIGLALFGMGWGAYAADWANIWVLILGGAILFVCAVCHSSGFSLMHSK